LRPKFQSLHNHQLRSWQFNNDKIFKGFTKGVQIKRSSLTL
jgi:hypothetical protein